MIDKKMAQQMLGHLFFSYSKASTAWISPVFRGCGGRARGAGRGRAASAARFVHRWAVCAWKDRGRL